MFFLAALFLVVSGVAALTYQVVWVRLLGLSMGSTSASVSTVLAAFFLGLAIGSYLAERITRNRIDNLNVYIVLEAVIGIAGLTLLPILLNLDSLMATIPGLGSTIEFKFAVAMVLLVVPTMCMGATFPVMAAILVRRQTDMGKRVSQLYSLNTAGAVFGAMFAGFVFIPNWGLDGAIYVAATLNAFIVALAIYMNSRIKLPPIETHDDMRGELTAQQKEAFKQQAPLRFHALVVLFATGFVAIATEVGWTKYLSIFTGTTIYGFSAILTIFLFGIAAGSWWVKKYLDRISRPEFWMAIGLVALGMALLFTRSFLSFLPPIFEAINHFSVESWLRHGVKYGVVFIMLIIPTFIFGALFPLNLQLYCGNLSGVRARIGKAYAVNTIASIFGAIVAGFWIIPHYGTDFLLTYLALIILVLPFIFIRPLPKPAPRIAVTVLAVIGIGSNWLFDHISYKDLIASVQYQYDAMGGSGKKPDVLYVKEGKTGVVSLVTYDGRYVRIQNNGLNESGFDKQDLASPPIVEYLLGLMPYFLHEDPKTAFVVGYGGGFTTRAFTLTERLESIKVVELEPAIVEAGRYLFGGEIPMLQDPRVTLQYNDARNTLLLEEKQYDLIAAQPSHPWLSRASTVFTKEFFQVVKSRLNEGGIYGQWLSMFNMDATTMKSIMKAFFEVFPEGFTMADTSTGDFLMFGSETPIVFNRDRVSERFNEEKIKQGVAYHDLEKAEDLLWYYALSRDQAMELAADSVPNTDMNILSEVRLSALDQNATGKESPYQMLWDNYTMDVNPILGPDAEDTLYLYAQALFRWQEYRMISSMVDNLYIYNPMKARAVELELMWRTYDYDGAIAAYEKYDEWPDETHRQQAQIMMELQRFADARQVIDRIQDKSLRGNMSAKWLYAQNKFDQLRKFKPESDMQKAWRLTALAQSSLKSAGKQLSELAGSVTFEEPQLRVLIRYFGSIDDARSMDRYSRQLVALIDDQVDRMSKAVEVAVDDKALNRAKSLLTRIVALNPKVKGIAALKRKVNALEQSKTVAS
ncbi:MAG: fused MFS/spermidine synthase [Gammaproteobacteria bacterium]|jgi:spermidine synthase